MSKHLKRRPAPRALRLHRKEKTWTVKSSPGPHALEQSIPLALIIRDYLGLCDTYKEARRIIANAEMLIDGVKRRNPKFPCGFMDVVSIPKLKKDYRILYDRNGKLTLIPITSHEATWKLCRIENKTIIKGNKIQLNLHDGRNAIVKKDEYKTGDVLRITFADNKINEVFPFNKGNVSLIIGGTHIGHIGNIEDIEVVHSSRPNMVKMKGETEFYTIKDYVFPVGTTKPVVTPPEVKIQ